MTPTNDGIPRERRSDRSSVWIDADGFIYVRTPDCGTLQLTLERAQEFSGLRIRELFRQAVLDSRSCITLKAKDQ